MAFPMEFNALQFILFCFVDELVLWLESHSVCVCVCMCENKSENETETELNPYKLPSSS